MPYDNLRYSQVGQFYRVTYLRKEFSHHNVALRTETAHEGAFFCLKMFF